MRAAPSPLGTFALIATAALWGSNHVVARAVREVVPLPALAFWRWLPGAVFLTLVAIPTTRDAWPAIRARLGELIIGGAVGVGVFSYLLLGGAYQSLAIEVGFINATTPVWVLLLGLSMGGAKITTQTKCGLALAFFGTILIICKGRVEALTAFSFSLGNLWSLLAALAFAWFSIRVRDWTRTIPPLALTVVTAWSGVIFVTFPIYMIWMFTGQPWLVWNETDTALALGTIGYMGLGPTMLGNLFYLYGVAAVGPARAAAFLYLSPLFSAALSIGWLGEQLDWYHIAGITAIFSGLIILGRAGQPVQQD